MRRGATARGAARMAARFFAPVTAVTLVLAVAAPRVSRAGDPPGPKPASARIVPTPVADLEKMCTLLTGCADLPISAPADVGDCVRDLGNWLARPDAVTFSLTLRECALGATSCGQLATCARRGVRPDACQGRGQNGPSAFCDVDGRAVTCVHGAVTQVRDCSRGGERCHASNGDAQCSLASVAGATGARSNDACADATSSGGAAPVARCSASGTHLLTCDQGKSASIDCAAFGLVCAIGVDGAGCAPASAACSTSADRCENGVAVRCLHGHEVRIDCGAAGLACDGAGAPVGACRVPSVAGGPVDPCLHAPAPSCGPGGSLTYCATAAGGMRRLSCKQGGLERCVRDSHGARCAP